MRAGFWGDHSASCLAALRSYYSPGNRKGLIGFRLASVPVE
jgi:formylglycine-generating enzyme required for sulfatase activity